MISHGSAESSTLTDAGRPKSLTCDGALMAAIQEPTIYGNSRQTMDAVAAGILTAGIGSASFVQVIDHHLAVWASH
jgi:hypothetical protein